MPRPDSRPAPAPAPSGEATSDPLPPATDSMAPFADAHMRAHSDADLAEFVESLDDAHARHMLREAQRLVAAIEARLSGSAPVVAGSPDSETLTVELTRDVYTTDLDLGARGGIRKRLRTGDVVPQPRAGLLLQRHREAVKVVKA